MTLATNEFIRRFLIHVLPKGLHRIRHYGLFANGHRASKLAHCRALLWGLPEQPNRTRTTVKLSRPRQSNRRRAHAAAAV